MLVFGAFLLVFRVTTGRVSVVLLVRVSEVSRIFQVLGGLCDGYYAFGGVPLSCDLLDFVLYHGARARGRLSQQ